MDLLQTLKQIDKAKIDDADVAEDLARTIKVYDPKSSKTINTAEMMLGMIQEFYPDALPIKNTEAPMRETEHLEEKEARTMLHDGEALEAVLPGGTTYPVQDENQLKAAIETDHEVQLKTPMKEKRKYTKKAKADKEQPKATSKEEPKATTKEEPEKPASAVKSDKKKITPENLKDCDAIIAELKTVLNKYQSAKPKEKKEHPKKKPLAHVVKEGVVSIIKRVVHREKDKKEIDVKKFKPVIEKGKEFLKALRKASGGISDDNDAMINSFEKQMTDIFESIQKKQNT